MILAAELAFQLLSAVDAGQTVSIHKTSSAYEAPFPRGAQWAIGREPSTRSALAYKAAEGLLHLAVTWSLRNHKKLELTWESVTIAGQAATDINNFEIGLRIQF